MVGHDIRTSMAVDLIVIVVVLDVVVAAVLHAGGHCCGQGGEVGGVDVLCGVLCQMCVMGHGNGIRYS